MFESDFLEYFSRVHPAIPSALYLPLSFGSLYFAIGVEKQSLWSVGLGVIAGYVLWTFFEYWLHRLLFHLPVVGPKTQRIYFLIHGVHHDYPWDETRLVIPTGASVVLGVLMYGLFRVVLGSQMYAPFAGFVMGYVAYDTVHWYVHARAPRNRFFRWLRREHLVHHFKEPNSRYGVSCPWLDYLFGTRGTQGSRATATEVAAEATEAHEAPQGAQPAR
jgi:sterol desaturase/sphingolipid hydroxylase (fatty acid hydroxylase superfamily)